jgi:hypothetical protein
MFQGEGFMKLAVIVVGTHFSGKSKTINKHLKPLLGIRPRAWLFGRKHKNGVVLSQSFEESGRSPDEVIARYSERDLFVLPARPKSEGASCLTQIESALSRHGFQYSHVQVAAGHKESFYEACAKDVLRRLDA